MNIPAIYGLLLTSDRKKSILLVYFFFAPLERNGEFVSKTKLIRILCGVILAGVLLVEGLAFSLVYGLSMLPTEYLILLAAFLLVLWVGLAALMFIPGRKKKTLGLGRAIAAALLVAIILFGCALASSVVAELQRTLNDISTPTELTAEVDLFVRVDDPAQKLEDAADYVFAITEYYDIENTMKAIEQLEATYGKKITTITYDHVYAMADALYAGQADAMLINTAYISILVEGEGYTDFMSKAKLLSQIDIRIVVQPPTEDNKKDPLDWLIPDKTEPVETTQPVETDTWIQVPEGKVTDVPFVVYLAGNDYKGEGFGTYSKNDVNILAVINPKTKQILMINTPRDYYIPNPAGNGALDKLTHCGARGVENSMRAISEFYQVPIRYYAQIGFSGLKELVDAVDGVTVYSDYSYIALDEVPIQKGKNHLNGEEALAFARDRKNVDGGDNTRGNHQMKVVKALIDKMISGKIFTRYADIMKSLRGLFRTSIPTEDMASLVQMQLDDMATWNIVSYAVTGTSGRGLTYSEPLYPNLFIYYPNMDTVEYARELMQRIIDGEIIQQSDIIPAD